MEEDGSDYDAGLEDVHPSQLEFTLTDGRSYEDSPSESVVLYKTLLSAGGGEQRQ